MINSKSSVLTVFKTILKFVENHPVFIITSFALLFFISIWGLQFSKLELDIYDVYDPNFQSSVDLTEMKEVYSDRSQMLVAFEFKKTPLTGEICKLLKWRDDLVRYKEVKNITSLWSVRAPMVRGEKVWYPTTMQNPCELKSNEPYEIQQIFSDSFFRHLISRTGSRNLVFDISFSGSDSDSEQVQHIINKTNSFQVDQLEDVSVSFLGMAAFRFYFKKIMLKDSIYNLLILLIILVFMRAIYGTWISGIYLGLTLIGANLILYGTIALAGIPIDILTNNLFLMTAVAGTADFIFVSQVQMSGDYRRSLSEVIAPSFFTTLTTIVGFLSLNSSDLDIIRRFGNGAAIGAVAEWAMLFLFLPALLKLLGKDKIWVNPKKALRLSFLSRLQELTLPRPFIGLFCLLMILSIPSFFFLNDQDSPVKNLPRDHVLRKAYEDFQDKFQWQGQVYLYFPQTLDAADKKRIIDAISELDMVYRVEDPDELAKEWTHGLDPLRKDLILRELSMTPLWERYYSRVDTLRIPLYLKEQDLHSLRILREEIKSICGSKCRLAGQRVVYLEYGEKISKTMIESFAVSILLVITVLAFLLWLKNKLQYLLPVALSALMGPLVTLTLIALFQIPVTLITSIFLAVMVGLAGDNAIHYLLSSEENLEEGIASRSKASIVVTLVMILSSSMFMLQSLLPMKILGLLFITGFFINLVGDLWGLKGILTRKVR
ncbi:MAG: MMPL family transporter [Bacteriovoracia bacterium]